MAAKKPSTAKAVKAANESMVDSFTTTVDTRERKMRGVSFPADMDELLKDLAFFRSKKDGGRVSVSGILQDLVTRHRPELEAELSALQE